MGTHGSLSRPCGRRAQDLFALVVALLCVVDSDGAAFTPGNIIVLVPQGSTSAAAAINLVEYSPSGTAVQTISVSGSCTTSASATSEGKLASSFDGSRVSWGCYACAAGTASIATVCGNWTLCRVVC